ncbi:MAG TPA: membrane protein insertase YidC [Pyrinomonadaceae bacterium]|nr:membrane protein insertase YidC [Pyrinomonadaceae bacterium]
MDQKRFIIALLISLAILLGWNYLFPIKTPPQNNANDSVAQQQPTASPPDLAPTTATTNQQPSPIEPVASDPDTTPQRKILVRTPLYDVELDSRGAVARSWVIKKNKDTGRDLYSVAGDKHNPQPLQLVSPEGLKRGEMPLRLITGDPSVDAALASKNYKVNGVESEDGDLTIDLTSGERRLDFLLHDDATGLDVIKSITFKADQYSAQIEVKLARGGQAIPQARLAIGPSIGDQGVSHYSFYSVAPEGVAVVGGEVKRFYASEISEHEESPDYQAVGGRVDWAGVGDTYFAMVAVPSSATEGLAYGTTKYEHQANGTKEARHLITAFVSIPTDGSKTELYTGPKDHYLLNAASLEISQSVRRQIDLEGLINYGFLSFISRPLAVPILWSIKRLNELTGSYGVAIILFTIIIYSLFFPLKWRSSKAMKKAQKLAPRMKELQEKIKGMKQNDPRLKELQMEQLRLMKEGNPLGGCLPLLIQMPFLFALYIAITISIDFRQASFLWIPDLSAAEPYTIHLLPILFAGSMTVLQLITPAPTADPLQRKMMAYGMPLFMLWMMWNVPSGLLVYWLVGNIVGFGQQLLINRLTKSEDDEEPPKEKKAEKTTRKKLNTARVSQA